MQRAITYTSVGTPLNELKFVFPDALKSNSIIHNKNGSQGSGHASFRRHPRRQIRGAYSLQADLQPRPIRAPAVIHTANYAADTARAHTASVGAAAGGAPGEPPDDADTPLDECAGAAAGAAPRKSPGDVRTARGQPVSVSLRSARQAKGPAAGGVALRIRRPWL